jgi:hypothetical protein
LRTALNSGVRLTSAPWRNSAGISKDRETVHFHGLKTSEQRRIERGLYRTSAPAVALCEQLMPDRYLESKRLALMLLARYRRQFEQDLLRRVKRWLELETL